MLTRRPDADREAGILILKDDLPSIWHTLHPGAKVYRHLPIPQGISGCPPRLDMGRVGGFRLWAAGLGLTVGITSHTG